MRKGEEGCATFPSLLFFRRKKSMNAISMIGPNMAMDGRTFYPSGNVAKKNAQAVPMTLPTSAAEVSQYLADNLAKTKETVQELQKLSDMVMGHTLQFNVNNELGKIIVEVVDPSTNKVIRQIPSEDLQRIQIQMKHAIGLLFDEMI